MGYEQGIDPKYYGEIQADKIITNGRIHIPANGTQSVIELETVSPCEGHYYRVIIGREDDADYNMTAGYWKLLLIYERNHSVIRIDYGYDLYNHHFATTHVHIGTPNVDEIAYDINDEIIQRAFPYLFNPMFYDIDFDTENGMIYAIEEAVKCFLITIHARNIEELGEFYYD